MTKLKILRNSDLEKLEEEVNEFLRLNAWFGRKITHVKVVSNYNYFYNFIFTDPIELTNEQKNLEIITRNQMIVEKPEYAKEMNRLQDKFYPVQKPKTRKVRE